MYLLNQGTIFKCFLTIATAKPMTVMMPNGTRTIPIPEPSVIASGNVVALKLVSFAVIVTVINVVLEVTLSLVLELVERKGAVVVVAGVGKNPAVVFAAVTAMVRCNCFNWRFYFKYLCGCCCDTQRLVCLMVYRGFSPSDWRSAEPKKRSSLLLIKGHFIDL